MGAQEETGGTVDNALVASVQEEMAATLAAAVQTRMPLQRALAAAAAVEDIQRASGAVAAQAMEPMVSCLEETVAMAVWLAEQGAGAEPRWEVPFSLVLGPTRFGTVHSVITRRFPAEQAILPVGMLPTMDWVGVEP